MNPQVLQEALRNCENEPVRLIGSIQDHGVLLAFDAGLRLQVVSQNVQHLIGLSAHEALGRTAQELLGPEIAGFLADLPRDKGRSAPLGTQLTLSPARWPDRLQAQIHRSDALLVLEVEFPAPDRPDLALDLESVTDLLDDFLGEVTEFDQYTQLVANRVREVSQFEHVMIYQFDHEWNGKVIAESRADYMPVFLGHHFPASDVPKPARELFTRNLVRMIADRDARAVPLLYAAHHQTPVDQTLSVLRSSSPIHLEYLRNMGVASTFTVSLLQNGKLWGLLTCHHRQPRRLSFGFRHLMQMVSKGIAARLSAIAFDHSTQFQTRVRDALAHVVASQQTERAGEALSRQLEQELFGLLRATGAVVYLRDDVYAMGVTPPQAVLARLGDWLRGQIAPGQVFATASLSSLWPEAAACRHEASGALALWLDDSQQSLLVWLREEVVRSIAWAGQNQKNLIMDERGPRLTPRQSFAAWVQTKEGESLPWTTLEVSAAQALSAALGGAFARHKLDLVASQFRTIFDSAADGILSFDHAGRVTRCNPALERLLGQPEAQLLGQSVDSVLPGVLAAVRASGTRAVSLETSAQQQSGKSRAVRVAAQAAHAGEATTYTAIIADITAQKDTEAALIRARESAEAASRTKSSFLATMSHEIRTPMNAIIGMTELVLDSPLMPEQEKLLQSSLSAAKSLLTILNDILDLSKLEAGRTELEHVPFALARLTRDICDTMRVTAEMKGLRLLVELDPQLPVAVLGDPARLRQVLINLIGNAIKFTPAGHVGLRVQTGRVPDVLEFLVEDTGIGISPEKLERIFDRFSQADGSTTRTFGGTGLGLTISREIVQLMGGRIHVESTPGKGSTFRFSALLPRAADHSVTVDSQGLQTQQHAPRTRPLRILLAEDVVLNQELVVRRLAQRGHSVDVADNGQIAVQKFQQERYDLILMDVMMPVMDGEAAARTIRALEAETGSHIPIIVLTASVLPSDQASCLAAGADDFVTKPIDWPALYRSIAKFFPTLDEAEPSRQEAVLPKLPLLTGLDVKSGLQVWMDMAAYRKALGRFAQEYAQSVQTLGEHFASQRWSDACLLAHTVKGLAGGLGALSLSGQLAALEAHAKHSAAPTDNELAQAQLALESTLKGIAELQRLVPDAQPASTQTETRTDPQASARLLARLVDALDRGELDEQAVKQLRGTLDPAAFGRLESLMDGFELDEAQKYAQALLDGLQTA